MRKKIKTLVILIIAIPLWVKLFLEWLYILCIFWIIIQYYIYQISVKQNKYILWFLYKLFEQKCKCGWKIIYYQTYSGKLPWICNKCKQISYK